MLSVESSAAKNNTVDGRAVREFEVSDISLMPWWDPQGGWISCGCCLVHTRSLGHTLSFLGVDRAVLVADPASLRTWMKHLKLRSSWIQMWFDLDQYKNNNIIGMIRYSLSDTDYNREALPYILQCWEPFSVVLIMTLS